MGSKVSQEKLEALQKILRDLGIHFPPLKFIEDDALYKLETAIVHEVDRTPVIVIDDGSGTGSGAPRTRCFDDGAIDLGGQSTTDNTGRLTWKLSDYVCKENLQSYLAPASFVTTALSTSPIFLTARITSIGFDLVIDVFSWDANGAAAPNVRFAWRCWVRGQNIIT